MSRNAVDNDKTLFISNLPNNISSTTISEYIWNKVGIEVDNVEVLLKAMPGGFKTTCGLAIVLLKNASDARLVRRTLDGHMVLGRPMIIRADKFMADDPSYVHVDTPPSLSPVKGNSPMRAVLDL
ncbi:hypothetical protein CEUSTIGMA_g1137.t1 [Chlamydomonas eustigma]|uniref:RRM domain-containing protein n=1 Tax=Chlamydomonas eustigma TaxID=1157962 RepID=A0A250WSG7_9CHLO|nr:hypothetical protein CEUSTIGMA_g1137.t1 [Chlamydomonas eustigma]|eukprot:GAX73686.1 hypothetical protein CEUSTIGMA_g1137.t1 [Chlamydomonas eustigma]